MPIHVKFKKLDPETPNPGQAHSGDAGYDLTSRIDANLKPGEWELIPTGIAISIPTGFAAFVQPRSGLAANHGISIVNTPGLIDSQYRGEIKVILINHSRNKPFSIKRGDKICQIVFQKVEEVHFQEVDMLDETERGECGFGSTGI
ncbi:MAG: dUTP diphosphatase [Actinomycetota bacterium]|nr:dUTP diphosphatase [Actinomycetota bacterium]